MAYIRADLSPLPGNKQLLKEIEESGLQERLIPQFIITPACFFEYGILIFCVKTCDQDKCARFALSRICQDSLSGKSNGLNELAQFEPALFISCRDFNSELDIRDIETLAGKFPLFPLC